MNKKKRFFLIGINITIVLLVSYLLLLPFLPEIKYGLSTKRKNPENKQDFFVAAKNIEKKIKEESKNIGNRLIINKIGVDAPIIESAFSEEALDQGAWRDPSSSSPDKGGNTVITGHRFKYLPPNNLTFYLLHKLEQGDGFYIFWEDEVYSYEVKEIKTVEADDLSILEQSDKAFATLYTCDPVFSQKNRLVVIGELLSLE